MDTSAQDAQEYYVWKPAGKSYAVHVHLAVIDALGAEVMRGFGAVPKRGAEVGGILLGSVERNSGIIVRIEDFEPVECGYTRGPSYLLSTEEREKFEDTAESFRADGSQRNHTVGYFRSHTRDGLALASEDVELMDACFPGAESLVLLVKPFATKPSVAGFFFRENGSFPPASPLEFPFRRRELTGEQPPERRPLTDRRPRTEEPRSEESRAIAPASFEESSTESAGAESGKIAYTEANKAPARSGRWMLVPLSFVFLLVGLALGYMVDLSFGSRAGAGSAADLGLSLAVQKSDGGLSVQWNGNSAAVRNANRGVLEVHDGGYAKTVDLDPSQLRGGKLAFHNASDAVSFHLTVYLNPRLSVSETLDWRQ